VPHLQNEQTVRQFADACLTGKYRKFGDYLSEDITCHIPGHNSISGTYNGVPAFTQLCMRTRSQILAYPLTTSLIHTVSGPAYVASTSLKETVINNKALTWQAKTLFFFRDQFIAACWAFVDDHETFDDYWSQPLPASAEAIRHSKPNTFPGLADFIYIAVDI
jgi:ketosteroid isomerase-like protein